MGGNAADAAIAVAAVLNFTAPDSTGVGGDCFALFYDATTQEITALNGSGRAPAALKLEDLRARSWIRIPDRSPDAVPVPGAVMGWHDLLGRHGTLRLADVLADAIHYAREGCPVSPLLGTEWSHPTTQGFLQDRPNTENHLPHGSAPRVRQGETGVLYGGSDLRKDGLVAAY